MKPISVVFFGRSGSGKGTQADLLLKHLAKSSPSVPVVYVETGDRLRNFVKGSDSFSAQLTRDTMAAGKLMPIFIPVWAWVSLLLEKFTGKEHLVFDGVARRIEEAPVLDSALAFYGRTDARVILLEVPVPEVTTRLLKRGRHDDKEEKIAERLRWYETDVVPSVEFFRKSQNCKFVTVNGHQSIEDVHRDVLKALEL